MARARHKRAISSDGDAVDHGGVHAGVEAEDHIALACGDFFFSFFSKAGDRSIGHSAKLFDALLNLLNEEMVEEGEFFQEVVQSLLIF